MKNIINILILFFSFVLIAMLVFSLLLFFNIREDKLSLSEYTNELYHKNQMLNRLNINNYKILQEKYPNEYKFYNPKKFIGIEDKMDSTNYVNQKSLHDTLIYYYNKAGDDFDFVNSLSFFKSSISDSVFLGSRVYPGRRDKWLVLINGKPYSSLTINNYDTSLSDSLVIELLQITANSEVSNFDTIKSRLVVKDL